MLCLLLKFKNSEIKTIETEKLEITIGRNPNCDIHIGKHSLLVGLKTTKSSSSHQNFGEKTMVLTK